MLLIVTGGSGFLGARIVRLAAARGHSVVSIGRSSRATRIKDLVLSHDVQHLRLDLHDSRAIFDAVERRLPSAIIHAAHERVAETSLTTEDAIRGCEIVGRGLAQAARVHGTPIIWVGSASEYADANEPIAMTHPRRPTSNYGKAKVAGWRAFTQDAPPRYGCLLPFNLYGPGEESNRFVPSALRAPLGRAENRFGDPSRTRDFVFVDDAATACLVAAEALVSGRAESGFEVPIATGVATTLRAAATLAADAVGVHGFSYNFEGHARAGDVNPQMLVGTTESAERLIGWSPSTSLRDGLRQTASELGLPVADATAEEVRSAELRKSGNESP